MNKIVKITFLIVSLIFVFMDYSQSFAADADPNITNMFFEETQTWIDKLTPYTKSLFALLLTINFALFGIGVVLKRATIEDTIEQFIMILIFSGFVLAFVSNYQEWTQELIKSLEVIAGKLDTDKVNTATPFKKAQDICEAIIAQVDGWEPIDSLGLLITGLIVMVCFALLTAQVVFIKCESMVALAAGMLLLGFGGLTQTKEYAINVMRYALSVAFKLFILQLVLGLGISFINKLTHAGKYDWNQLFTIIGSSIILYVLVKSLPDTISGIINGSHVSSGHQLASAVMSVAATAGGVGWAAGKGAFSGGMGAVAASQQAKEQGFSGLGRAGQTAKNLMGAYGQARQQMPGRSAMAKMMDNARANLASSREAKKVDNTTEK